MGINIIYWVIKGFGQIFNNVEFFYMIYQKNSEYYYKNVYFNIFKILYNF